MTTTDPLLLRRGGEGRMRDRGCRRHTCRHVGMGVLLVATMLAMLVGPAAVVPAAAQDDLGVPTRVVVLHADWSLGPVDVYLNHDEVLSGFAYGQVSDWISFEPGSVRVTITTDRSGLNYSSVAVDAVYPAPAGNDYSLIITNTLILGCVF